MCVSTWAYNEYLYIWNFIQTSLYDKCISILERHTFYRYPHTISTYPHTQVCGYLHNVVLQISTYYIHIPTYMSTWISIQRMAFYILYRDAFISIIERHTFYRYPHTISTCCIDIHVLYPHTHIHKYVHILYPHTHIHGSVDIYRTYDVLYF